MQRRSRPVLLTNSGGHGARAFTLVEVLVSLTICSLLVVSVVSASRTMATTKQSVDSRVEQAASARRAIETIVAALRNVRRDPIQREPVLIGYSGASEDGNDRIDLLVTSNRRFRQDGAESDQYEMSFYVGKRAGTGLPALMCRKDHGLDEHPDEGGIVTVVADGIVGLSFEYLSGTEFKSEWSQLERLAPDAVRVTVAAMSMDPQSTDPQSLPGQLDVTVLSTMVAIRVNAAATQNPDQGPAAPETGGPTR